MKSYSRGAWLATIFGLGYLAFNWWQTKAHLTPALSSPPMGGEGDSFSRIPRVSRFTNFFRRNWLPLSVVFLSAVVLTFWNYRHTERVVARRAFSVGNVNDFSWRNRVSALEGALRIMAEKPWLGVGWKQPQQIYDQYYRPVKVDESAAIQMNDHFMLGMSLGIPALVCFAVYVAISLTRRAEQKAGTSPRPSPQSGEGVSSLVPCPLSPGTICRAGAIVLLVGFFLDGGLFKLATGATFWILLELGRED